MNVCNVLSLNQLKCCTSSNATKQINGSSKLISTRCRPTDRSPVYSCKWSCETHRPSTSVSHTADTSCHNGRLVKFSTLAERYDFSHIYHMHRLHTPFKQRIQHVYTCKRQEWYSKHTQSKQGPTKRIWNQTDRPVWFLCPRSTTRCERYRLAGRIWGSRENFR